MGNLKTVPWHRTRSLVLWTVITFAVLTVVSHFVSADTRTVAYQVHSGDTLWSIASHINTSHPQQTVQKIEQLNHIAGNAEIYPGEVLQIPHS